MMLSKGQQWDWLGDVFWRVQTLVVLVRVGGLVLLDRPRDCGSANPWSTFGRWRERNFAVCCIIIFRPTGTLRVEHVAPGPVAVAVWL